MKFGWILGTRLRPAAFPLIVDSSQDSTVSKEVVIVSSSVACARVVWGRYWYSNAALGPWCVWSGASGRGPPRARCAQPAAGPQRARRGARTRSQLSCHALALSPRVVARCAE